MESALLRPQMGYYDGPIEEAAALMESLAMNHPFVDGNKRVAFFTTDAFLRMNGTFIDCDSEETYSHFMRLFETNSFRFAELRSWLEEHVKPMSEWPGSHHGLRPRLAGGAWVRPRRKFAIGRTITFAIGRTITLQLDAP